MVSGKPSPLNSSFKLSFYTLLNLLRRLESSGHDMEYVIARSFQQFQHERQIPKVSCTLNQLPAAMAGQHVNHGTDIKVKAVSFSAAG